MHNKEGKQRHLFTGNVLDETHISSVTEAVAGLDNSCVATWSLGVSLHQTGHTEEIRIHGIRLSTWLQGLSSASTIGSKEYSAHDTM